VLIARIQERPQDALLALDEGPARLPDTEMLRDPRVLRAQILSDMGDSIRARKLFEDARKTLERLVRERPDDFRRHLALGHAYAGLGRGGDARREAVRAMAIMPPSRTVPAGTLAMREAAEILSQIPEYRAEAVALLDELMQMPAGREVSVPLLRVDPAWKCLRNDPGFHRLLEKYSGT
jgi:serine/threonine-protein kinase